MIGKTLKGLFFTEDDIPEVVNTEVEITATAPVEIVATAPVVTPTISAGVNEEMANMLMTAIQDADLEGFDYLEFRNTVNEMGATGMTEANKFLAVFTTAKAMGLTYDKLIDSIGHYQNVIVEQREGFMAQVEQQLANEVEARMTEIDERNAKIAEASEEIAKLNQYIQESQQENLKTPNKSLFYLVDKLNSFSILMVTKRKYLCLKK